MLTLFTWHRHLPFSGLLRGDEVVCDSMREGVSNAFSCCSCCAHVPSFVAWTPALNCGALFACKAINRCQCNLKLDGFAFSFSDPLDFTDILCALESFQKFSQIPLRTSIIYIISTTPGHLFGSMLLSSGPKQNC